MRDYAELLSRLKQSDLNCNMECYECSGECTGGSYNIFCEAADAIEELLAAVPHWISVEERLPEKMQSVFVARKFLGVKGQFPPCTYVEMAYRVGDNWLSDSDEYKIARSRHTNPTHWMPLPAPPKEDKP